MPALPLRLVLPLAALLTAAAVWMSSTVQRDAATRAAERTQLAERLLIGMLEQETGLRGFQVTADPVFLEPFTRGRAGYASARADLSGSALGEEPRRRLEQADRVATRWMANVQALLARTRGRRGPRVVRADVLRRKALMDAFRRENTALQRSLERERRTEQASAGILAAGLVGSLLLVLSTTLAILSTRRRRADEAGRAAEHEHLERQGEFGETLAVVRDEAEAHALLHRHLVRARPGRTAAVLTANNSDNRLIRSAPADGDAAPAGVGGSAAPQDCVAVRLGRVHEQTESGLLRCELCGTGAAGAGAVACTPLLVRGQVIGSVLVAQDEPLVAADRRLLRESVSQAAPVIGNLRTISIAESRAATDVLTGLPNRRSADQTLRRMVAQAGRALQPLSAIAIDVDHFKAINDTFGHDKGDEVLAAVGAVLQATIRESDFAARVGGEEFLVLGPGADAEGGQVLARNLRAAVSRIQVPGVARAITASFGVATCPDHATTPEQLTRCADRALYAAKGSGRDRVEVATA